MFQGGPCLNDITNMVIIYVLPIYGCKHSVHTTDLKSTVFRSSLIAVSNADYKLKNHYVHCCHRIMTAVPVNIHATA